MRLFFMIFRVFFEKTCFILKKFIGIIEI